MSGSVKRHLSKLLNNKKMRAQSGRLLALSAAMVSLGVAAILMQRGVAMSRAEYVLDCPQTGAVAHTHNADCYDANGNLVCPLPELALHTHDESCYTEERELACSLPEHTHTSACYDADGALVCGLEEHKHTDACYRVTRELTCDQRELTTEHVHGASCFRPADPAERDGAVELPAQTFRHEFTAADADGAEHVVLAVSVDAPEGALPAGTTMQATWLAASDLSAQQQEAVQRAAAAKANGPICSQQAVDLAFYDAKGNEVEPALPVVVTFASDLLATQDQPVVVHISDLSEAQLEAQAQAQAEIREQKLTEVPEGSALAEALDPAREARAVDALTKAELAEHDLTLASDELAFESDSFSTYVLAMTTLEHSMRAEGTTVSVTVTAPAEAGIPADAELQVSEVDPNTDDYRAYQQRATEALDAHTSQVALARFFDISIVSGGEELQPAAPVAVQIELSDAPEAADAAGVVHFGATDAADQPVAAQESDGTVSFDAEGFSVYGVVYTVDFHWQVDGHAFDLSVAGGSTVSLREALVALGVVEQADLDQFVAGITNVAFSNPELVHVAQVTASTTAGALKEALGLHPAYSAELGESDIAALDAKQLTAPDWALVCLQPFSSDETLTVTMRDGQAFVLKVTDAQDVGKSLNGRKYAIYLPNDDSHAMLGTVNAGASYSILNSGLSSLESAAWTFEYDYGQQGYRLKAYDGTYLKFDGSNRFVTLTSNSSDATVWKVRKDGDKYSLYKPGNSNDGEYLHFNVNTTNRDWSAYDCDYSSYVLQSASDKADAWFTLAPYVAGDNERRGDWLVYLDEKRDEITLHVGETLTLRPYDEWTWKESDIQTAHWNLSGVSDWTIASGDTNGSKKNTWADGVFTWTRYVKYDDQLVTRYWSVQGKATKTGDYTLTNTKNGHTITVHVVPGSPVNQPPTITNTAGIRVNLFDYDKDYLLDPSGNTNLANNGNNKGDSINKEGGNSHFYFLSSGGGYSRTESWNNYTKDAANPNIVQNELDANGYPVLNHTDIVNWPYSSDHHTSLQYLFDTSEASQVWHGGNNNDAMICYPDVEGMFQRDANGYFYYNSNSNYFYYDTNTGATYLYEHTYTQTSGEEKGSLVNDKPIGFFPFHPYDSTSNLYVNQNHNLNHHVGLSMDIDFILPADKRDAEHNNQPYVFDFSGDDDLWVFLEWTDANGKKHSKLMLDLGGIHQPITGSINFTDDDSITGNTPYRLKVFYLERGGCDSNCSIRFNLPVVKELSLSKRLRGLTNSERAKYKSETFTYEVFVGTKGNEQLYNGSDTIRTDANGRVIERGFTITNGQVSIKDGETVTITGLPRNGTFYVAEEKSLNMDQFETPHAERVYHDDVDASEHEEEITLTESHTEGAAVEVKDWVTKEYELEDTERVTFTNTLNEKDLEVEKKWEGEQEPPVDAVTFTVSATIEGDDGTLQPYDVSMLKENGHDKQFTLGESNGWHTAVEHLPVLTPKGKLIYYEIKEAHVSGYVSSQEDLTAETYNYCDVDVVKYWPDDEPRTEVIPIKLQNKAGAYYAGVDSNGDAIFNATGETFNLTPDNDYTHRFERLPYDDSYTVVQVEDKDSHTKGLVTYRHPIIQYRLTNTPSTEVDPGGPQDNPVISKRIDALRDGATNPDSPHAAEDKTDLYRLYLDYRVDSLQTPDGVDLLFVIDHSGSMNNQNYQGNPYRAPAVMAALNGTNGLVAQFLEMNDKNQWAAVGFKGADGARDYWVNLLGNPWNPRTDNARYNAGEVGSEVLSPRGTAYEFTREANDEARKQYVDLPNNGDSILTNYTAGFWRAEQFLLKDAVKNDGRKKVVVFISDGIPTLHIDCPGETLQNAGSADGSPYYRDGWGGCPGPTLTEFGYFINDITNPNKGNYTLGDSLEFYTIGFGGDMQIGKPGEALLRDMLDAAYGEKDHEGHFMTIADTEFETDWWGRIIDPDDVDYSAATNKLLSDLKTIMGMNETFNKIVIQDDLSRYVDLYRAADQADVSGDGLLASAKAKMTMTVPDPEHPNDPTKATTVLLWDASATPHVPAGDAARFTKPDKSKAPIIKAVAYEGKQVKVTFDPDYVAQEGVTYTLSFDVKTTDAAYEQFAAAGYDCYAEGERAGQVVTGDPDTDFLGTTPPNATSVGKPGFRSNTEAKTTYDHNGKPEHKDYPHPVIQVGAKVDIVKEDETGAALEGATFSLYGTGYDASKTAAQNAPYLLEQGLTSAKPEGKTEAVVRSGTLGPGTYYLVETVAPGGFIKLKVPVVITVTADATTGAFEVTATKDGKTVGNLLVRDTANNGVWKLRVQNSSGTQLPSAGGGGVGLLYAAGALMVLGAGLSLLARGRRTA